MPTECSADLLGFARVEGRSVVAAFDGGKITSDAGGVLLGAADRAIGLVGRFARCFSDSRSAELVEHTVGTMVGQRVFGIALGYEDIVDHDELRKDLTVAVLAGNLK
jgi:Transposase DDE domain group 1